MSEKKTCRKLPAKIFAFVEYKVEEGKVVFSKDLVLLKSVDEVLDKIRDPEFMATHQMYTLDKDALYS